MRHHLRATLQRWLGPRATRSVAILSLILLIPIPWLHVVHEDPPGSAWRLDGRLVVQDEVMNPPGRWSWLTVGRPPLLAEVAHDHFFGEDPPRDMRDAPASSRPTVNEPAAAAVGLAHAGYDIRFGLIVQGLEPISDTYPAGAVITEFNGIELTDRAAWQEALGMARDLVTFRTADGTRYAATGPTLPYERVDLIDLAPDDLEAAILGRLASFAPIGWFRSMSLGRSHGMMVALTTYAHTSELDLAQGRHIAGTGGIRGDGAVTRIGGLPAKATAARKAGADVLVFPAMQAGELEGFDPGRMQLLPVTSLSEAIVGLLD